MDNSVRFLVNGARKEDGKAVSLTVQATSEEDAANQANDQGIMVSSVKRKEVAAQSVSTATAPPPVPVQEQQRPPKRKKTWDGPSVYCQTCGNQMPANASVCTKCGVTVQQNSPEEAKSRTVYVLLAIFIGDLGIHNFYAGRTGQAVGQLLLTVFGIFTAIFIIGFVFIFAAWVWAIVDACVVKKDGNGVPFK